MPSDFSVVAIVSAFNEADVIGPVVGDLIAQGLQVYFLDDGSTDDTVAIVEPLVGRGVLAIERLRQPSRDQPAERFDWVRILERKTALAGELDADWFVHHDADEFRESPWAPLTLKEAIRSVDALGFNAIDFWSLDFWPIDDGFRAGGDVRRAITGYVEGAPFDRLQIRCWKKTGAPIDLVSSGGHEARFAGRQVFPQRFILRHYPVRGQAHGERKVFRERRDRLRAEERARGWHVQYDEVREGASFLRDPATLTAYDPDAVRVALTLRHRGLETLESALDEARAIAETRRLEVEAQRLELERQRAHIEERRQEIETWRGAHEARTRELRESLDTLATTRAALGAKQAEADTLRDRLDHQARNVEGLEGAVREGARRLDEIHRSVSWRCTAPARAAYRVFRGR
jgi:hypothetical protein